MSSRTSSRNSGARIIGAVGNGAGDMPASRKSSARTEFAQGSNASFSSSLEVLEPGDAEDVSGRSSSRVSLGSRSRSSLGQVPPRSDSSLSQRVTTPTKHVSLTAVRRKQEVESPIEPELDWREFTRSNSRLGLGGRSYSSSVYLTETVEETTADEAEVPQKMTAQASAKPSSSSSSSKSPAEVTTQMEAMALHSTAAATAAAQPHHKPRDNSRGDREDHEDDNDDDDDDAGGDDDDSDSDEEPRKAPNELLMEFLDCIMKKDFKNAEKLCRMILIYEPTNKEATTFHPIILEKLQLEQEAAEAGEDGSGEEEEEGDDDDDEDDSDEDSSLESDSSDDDDDDDEELDQADGEVHFFMMPEEDGPQRPDSGIGM